MRIVASVLSLLTSAVSLWMLVMYLVLRHPGFQWRAAVAGAVFVGAISLIGGRPARGLAIPTCLWAVALLGFGLWALTSSNDDGWVLIAGTLFAAESVAALIVSVPRAGRGMAVYPPPRRMS
jgi:hypothetical protein